MTKEDQAPADTGAVPLDRLLLLLNEPHGERATTTWFWDAVTELNKARAEVEHLKAERDELARQVEQLVGDVRAVAEDYTDAMAQLREAQGGIAPRVLELARMAMYQEHYESIVFGGTGHRPLENNELGFSVCPHPDCQAVRSSDEGREEGKA